MDQTQSNDTFSFSKLNHIKFGKSAKSTRPQKINQDNRVSIDMSRTSSIVYKEEVKPTRSWKLIIRQGNKYKMIFDAWIGIIAAYSWITSAFYASYQSPSNSQETADLCIESFFWIDILLKFFEEYTDTKSHEVISDHKNIAFHYVFKSTFVLDFIAVFPFYNIFGGKAILTKLLRLVRLPKLIRLIDSFKFFKLVVIATVITYFFGWIWFLLSKLRDEIDNTTSFYEDPRIAVMTTIQQWITSCYYMLTTLATIGYGDYYPLNNFERIIWVVVMLFGVAFFSYIMRRFIEIIGSLNVEKSSTENDESDLKNWFTILGRFKKNKSLSKKLTVKIQNYFEYYWENDRLSSIKADNEYMKALPRSIKRKIMINYLFGDVFFLFRHFFRSADELDSKFLYSISFGFQPRRFEEDEIIYEEETEASEIYFIMKGSVNVGCRLPGVAKPFMLQKSLKERQIIADFYVCFNKKSEFLYQAAKQTDCYCLTKKFINEIFQKFPTAASRIKEYSFDRYRVLIKNPMKEMRAQKLEELNLRSSYKVIKIEDKEEVKSTNQSKIVEKKNNAKVQKELKQKIDTIQEKMNKFLNRFKRFENIKNEGFQKFVSE